jgi:hypothetical protein
MGADSIRQDRSDALGHTGQGPMTCVDDPEQAPRTQARPADKEEAGGFKSSQTHPVQGGLDPRMPVRRPHSPHVGCAVHPVGSDPSRELGFSSDSSIGR